MTEETTRDPETERFPRSFLWAVLVVCALPTTLHLFGVSFATQGPSVDPVALAAMSDAEASDALHAALRGSFTHTILEWSAFCVALFTVVLAFANFAQARRGAAHVTPIVAMTLFWAGCMDAFHTLAADRLISATANHQDLIPFTWALCRTFNAGILIIGVGALLFRRTQVQMGSMLRLIVVVGVGFGVTTYLIIHLCATSAWLPRMIYPHGYITRPWDVAPLVLFAFSGLYLYRKFYQRYRSHFAMCLWLSALPEGMAQLHTAVGSTALFDSHFNIAHFLKVIAYLVPCCGLVLDYVQTHRRERRLRRELEAGEAELRELNRKQEAHAAELARSNEDLEQFAYVASHDLQEPLRMVTSYVQLLARRYEGKLDDKADGYIGYAVDGTKRMRQLLEDLLAYSRVGSDSKPPAPVDLNEVVEQVRATLEPTLQRFDGTVRSQSLPTVLARESLVYQLMQNLVGNAVKFRREDVPPVVEIGAERDGAHWRLSVRDNGIGIDPQYAERVFQVFQRLHERGKYPGTGIGLSVAKKIVERHGGRIWIESTPGEGTTFLFTLPAADLAVPGEPPETPDPSAAGADGDDADVGSPAERTLEAVS